jgi:uncharacterized membrane protein
MSSTLAGPLRLVICVLPANITGAMRRLPYGGMEQGPVYLFFRIPLQLLFIWAAYYFGIRKNRQR